MLNYPSYIKALPLFIAMTLAAATVLLFVNGQNPYVMIIPAVLTAGLMLSYVRVDSHPLASQEELDELFKYRTEASEAILSADDLLSVTGGNSAAELIRQNIADYLELPSETPRTSEAAQRLIHENARIAANIKSDSS